ncbi:hypothetical protein BB561_006981 [Smittium simulii]|uniref:Aspartic peptidase DDI1-type domain-containing protein n=1 Tax=Smittium simulii TaxID=133385 RepID=A0A2T9XYH9_9FUNG|nr:hypothetical protein BB561_006981 [Smittium simulii]
MLSLSSASETKNIQHNIVKIPSPIDEQIVATAEKKRIRVAYLLNNHYSGTTTNISTENFHKSPQKDEGPKTIILTKIANKDISIFIDTGTINSIIDYNVLVSLNGTPVKLDTLHYIKPMGGAKIALDHCVYLDVLLEEDVQISASFLVMKDCALLVLIRIYILQENETNISYTRNIIIFGSSSECSVQLYSKEILRQTRRI